MKTTTHISTNIGDHTEALAAESNSSQISNWIDQLSSPSVVVRERARESLVDLGRAAVGELISTFETADGYQRWEACKALTEIADPASIAVLIHALESNHQDIRWVAAEGLTNIGSDAIAPLLVALIHRACAYTILDGAYHVLHAFAKRASEPIFDALIAAIRGSHPGVSVPPAAEHALLRWRELSTAANARYFLKSTRRRFDKTLPTPLL